MMRRVLSFLAFRLVPALLIAGIVWFGWQAVQSAGRMWSEQRLYDERAPLYAATATALSDGQTGYRSSGVQLISYQAQAFVTNTPRPENPAFATNTPHTADDAPQATATLPPVGTPAPLPTIIFAQSANEGVMFNGTAVPTAVPAVERLYNLTNILLLGQDNELTGESLARTDTMIMVSVNRDTNTVSMLSFPRDLYVYMPNGTMGRINTVYGIGEAIGWTGGGFFFLRQTLLYNFGINAHYYAMVDLSGFSEAIDILGGVNIAVDCAVQNLPLIGAEVPKDAYRFNDEGSYVLPVGYYALSGKEALWYARSRDNSSDFDRGRRQQQILRAAWRKARDTDLLSRLPELWSQGTEIIDTDLGFADMLGLLPIALNLNLGQIENYTMVRTYHTTPWQTPDGDYVQVPNPVEMAQLMRDFYTPPAQNQIAFDTSAIRIFNATQNANWDRVAAERLGWEGLNALAMGESADGEQAVTTLIDYTSESKGSPIGKILKALNIRAENVVRQPDPNRVSDFDVILGTDYNSCSVQGILPPQ